MKNQGAIADEGDSGEEDKGSRLSEFNVELQINTLTARILFHPTAN